MNDLFQLDSCKILSIKNKENVSLYAKIENMNIQKAVNNNEYLNMTLIDETGSMNAKKWNVTDNEKAQFKIGQLVFITGYGSEYNGKVQLIIETMRQLDERDDVDLQVFYQSSPISRDELKKKIYSYLNFIKNEKLLLITKTIFTKYEEKMLIFPAAQKNHHAYISGLAHHIATMLDLAKAMSEIYPTMNTDLLYSGIILHDCGKVIELSDHLAPEYTTAGKLIGHINLCFEEIRLTAEQHGIEGEEVMLLQHLILSHHGLLEYGSPKTPMLLEAEVLHLIDLADSRIAMINDELSQTNQNEFTKRIYSLDSRAFYKHNL